MSLTSVAAPIWNEIAKTQELKTAWARKAFAMTADEMAALEDAMYQTLMKQNNHQVVSAYLDAKPILLERKAISAHLQKHPELRNALPEVTTVAEAVSLVSMDRPLSRSEQAKLTQLLKADLG